MTVTADARESFATARIADAYIRVSRVAGLFAEAVAASHQIEAAQREVNAAEHELTLYLETDLISTIGPVAFRQGVKARQQTLDAARAPGGATSSEPRLGRPLER